MVQNPQLEIACFNLESALIAQQNGADRVELCDEISLGGTTPKFEIIQQAKAMHDEEIKNAQMDMFNHLNDLPDGLTYFARIQDAEDFADNYKTFAGNNE